MSRLPLYSPATVHKIHAPIKDLSITKVHEGSVNGDSYKISLEVGCGLRCLVWSTIENGETNGEASSKALSMIRAAAQPTVFVYNVRFGGGTYRVMFEANIIVNNSTHHRTVYVKCTPPLWKK